MGEFLFLSTLSLRRATGVAGISTDARLISIHALLAESDTPAAYTTTTPAEFLSTLSLRRATAVINYESTHREDFYPRSPCGERPCFFIDNVYSLQFLSTLSLRRATLLLVEILVKSQNFYPRSPCGERPSFKGTYSSFHQFLSTLSLRRATFCIFHQPTGMSISIHALLAESDVQRGPRPHQRRYFYPRSPCGERRCPAGRCIRPASISIHALLAESDTSLVVIGTNCVISIHALLAESDLMTLKSLTVYRKFLSTLSLRRATFKIV